VKNFIYTLNGLLMIDPSFTHEAVVEYKDGVSSQRVPAALTPFLSASSIQGIIQALTQGTTNQRSYASTFERIRDNVFCTGSQCGDRVDAPNVILFVTGGAQNVRASESQALMNFLKGRVARPAFVITVGVGPQDLQAVLRPTLTDFSTCSSYAYFTTSSGLSTNSALLSAIYNAIVSTGPGPVFAPWYNTNGVSGEN
jgi:hypothetical protein